MRDQIGAQYFDQHRDRRSIYKIIKRLCVIAVMALTIDAFVFWAAFPQQDELEALKARVVALNRAGKFSEAVPVVQRILAITEKTLGAEHPDVATSLSNLANLYNNQGRYADAEPLYTRALAINEKTRGPNHADVATSLNNLALLYANQGRDADAEPLYKRSLAIREKALGPNHPNVAQSLNNLALLYQRQGRYADAELLYKRSLAIYVWPQPH